MMIVCFGDSLTAGYQSPTVEVPYYQETPYGQFLQQWLGDQGTVIVKGVNGELTSDMLDRFTSDALALSPQCVIILGGTNDLGANISPSVILKNLSWMYERARNAEVLPVAVTVPSLRIPDQPGSREWLRTHIERRFELNDSLKTLCLRMEIPCVDLFAATTEEASPLLDAQYSNDGLHLSTRGYELLAKLVWEHVEKYRQTANERYEP